MVQATVLTINISIIFIGVVTSSSTASLMLSTPAYLNAQYD